MERSRIDLADASLVAVAEERRLTRSLTVDRDVPICGLLGRPGTDDLKRSGARRPLTCQPAHVTIHGERSQEAAMDTIATRRRFTVHEYERMIEAGILTEDDRVELTD